MFEDKTLKCEDCGQDFIFTAGEQEFYAEKGFQNEPKRCNQGEPRDVHCNLRKLRQRGKGSFPAQQRQTRILQRVLRGNEGTAVISRRLI